MSKVGRPAAIVGGSLLVFLRAASGVLWGINLVIAWPKIVADDGLSPDESAVAFTLACAGGVFWVALFTVLGLLTWRGSRGARLLLMFGSTVSIIVAAADYFSAGQEITVRTTLMTLTLDILVLLAFSSKNARAWSQSRDHARASA